MTIFLELWGLVGVASLMLRAHMPNCRIQVENDLSLTKCRRPFFNPLRVDVRRGQIPERLVDIHQRIKGLSKGADLGMLPEGMAHDIMQSLRVAIRGGAIFDSAPDPLAIFQQAVHHAIRRLEEDQRHFELFVRFLRDGPYEGSGEIPPNLILQRLTDEETGQAIRFIYYRVVNAFQGALAELLAVGPCFSLFSDLRQAGRIAAGTRFYVGDATALKVGGGARMVKGADIMLLSWESADQVRVVGLAEVKSYRLAQKRLENQINKQIQRAGRGVFIQNGEGQYDEMRVTPQGGGSPFRVGVVPSSWRLPRTFRLNPDEGLLVDPPNPPVDTKVSPSPSSWRITLRWSHEALASAAFEMTFWLMGEIGKVVYAQSRPPEWQGMTLEEVGQNASKMMLYYAILRSAEPGPAIALYNAYGFGYALGVHFKDPQGRRAMLWFDDLKEIAAQGVTKRGCRLR